MKKYYLGLAVLVFVLALVGCKSKEDKALELIDKEMFQTLYDYDSYQPVETKLDSAFTQYLMDDEIRANAIDLAALSELRKEYEEEADEAETTMEIWEDSYYSRDRYYKAKKEFVEATVKRIECMSKELNSMKSLYKGISEFEKEFCGWEVTHKFRCKSKGGSSLLTTYHYIVDEKVENIIYQWDEEDEDYMDLVEWCEEMEDMTDDDITKIDEQLVTLGELRAKYQDALKDL